VKSAVSLIKGAKS